MKNDFSENVMLFDWVTLSYKGEDPQTFIDLLGMRGANWEPMVKGRNGYRQGIFFGNISILYDGLPGMGICLDMSGQGCRSFEEFGTGDFEGLFHLARTDERFHLARLDVAFDDHSGILNMNQLFHDTDDQEYVSKFRRSMLEKEFNDGRPGITIYHGSKKSDILIRIYDKAAERGLPEDKHWVRVEMQLRDDRALAFAMSDLTPGDTFLGVLVNYVRYVEPDGEDSNKWRWPMKDYWAELIGAVGRVRLFVKPGIEYNIMQLDNFVFSQAGNAISASIQIHGVNDFLHKLHERETTNNPKYERLVHLYGPKHN